LFGNLLIVFAETFGESFRLIFLAPATVSASSEVLPHTPQLDVV